MSSMSAEAEYDEKADADKRILAELSALRGDGVSFEMLKDANATPTPFIYQGVETPDLRAINQSANADSDQIKGLNVAPVSIVTKPDGCLSVEGKYVMVPNRCTAGFMNGPERDTDRYGLHRFELGTKVKQQLIPSDVGQIVSEFDFTANPDIGEFAYLVKWDQLSDNTRDVWVPRSLLYRYCEQARSVSFVKQKVGDRSELKCKNGWTFPKFARMKKDQLYSIGGQAVRVLCVDLHEMGAFMPKVNMAGSRLNGETGNDVPFWRMESLDKDTVALQSMRDVFIKAELAAKKRRTLTMTTKAKKLALILASKTPSKRFKKKPQPRTNLFAGLCLGQKQDSQIIGISGVSAKEETVASLSSAALPVDVHLKQSDVPAPCVNEGVPAPDVNGKGPAPVVNENFMNNPSPANDGLAVHTGDVGAYELCPVGDNTSTIEDDRNVQIQQLTLGDVTPEDTELVANTAVPVTVFPTGPGAKLVIQTTVAFTDASDKIEPVVSEAGVDEPITSTVQSAVHTTSPVALQFIPETHSDPGVSSTRKRPVDTVDTLGLPLSKYPYIELKEQYQQLQLRHTKLQAELDKEKGQTDLWQNSYHNALKEMHTGLLGFSSNNATLTSTAERLEGAVEAIIRFCDTWKVTENEFKTIIEQNPGATAYAWVPPIVEGVPQNFQFANPRSDLSSVAVPKQETTRSLVSEPIQSSKICPSAVNTEAKISSETSQFSIRNVCRKKFDFPDDPAFKEQPFIEFRDLCKGELSMKRLDQLFKRKVAFWFWLGLTEKELFGRGGLKSRNALPEPPLEEKPKRKTTTPVKYKSEDGSKAVDGEISDASMIAEVNVRDYVDQRMESSMVAEVRKYEPLGGASTEKDLILYGCARLTHLFLKNTKITFANTERKMYKSIIRAIYLVDKCQQKDYHLRLWESRRIPWVFAILDCVLKQFPLTVNAATITDFNDLPLAALSHMANLFNRHAGGSSGGD